MQGKLPDRVELGDYKPVNDALDAIKDSFVNNYSVAVKDWQDKAELITDFSKLSKGFLVIKNSKGNHWVILGIKDNNDVSLGSAPYADFQKALDAATNLANWDPRKIIFNKDGNVNQPLSIAWAGRAGASLSTPGNAVLPYTNYDGKYSHIIGNKTFGVLGTYNVTGFASQKIIDEESEGLGPGVKVESYIYEEKATSASGRKAWFWYGASFTPPNVTDKKVQILKGNSLRFGYGTEDTDYPTQTGRANKGTTLKKVDQDDSKIQNNTNPDGKTFFFRGVDRIDLPNGGSTDTIYFLTTVVAYGIRMRIPETEDGSKLLTLKEIKDVKEGIMEFDGDSYRDASSDQLNADIDQIESIPKGVPLDDGKTRETIKIPFIFFRSATQQ